MYTELDKAVKEGLQPKNLTKVKRYHRSFIGLMEQSNTGEWVRSEDFDNLVKQDKETEKANAAYWDSLLNNLEEAQRQTHEATEKKLAKAKGIIAWHRSFLVGLVLCSLITTIVWRFF